MIIDKDTELLLQKTFILLNVSASDQDFGSDGDLVFEIQSLSNNGYGKFTIQQNNKEKKASIICNGLVSRGVTYVIIVRVTDQATNISRRRCVLDYVNHLLQT